MPIVDLGRFLDDDELVIPKVKSTKFPEGKDYHVPSPDAETGLWLSGLASLGARVANGDTKVTEEEMLSLQMNDKAERNFIEVVLSTAYPEMVADGVSWVAIQRMSQYAFAYFAISPQAAAEGVKSGAFSGKAPKPAAQNATRAKSQRSPASAGSKSRTKTAG